MERVSHLTKKQVPLATIFQAATIERLANLLREETPSAPASSLVEIQKGNLHPPLFFIHPSGGNVFRYVDLARLLGPEQPFYGLQAQGLDGEQAVHTRIEEMAAHYLGLIRTVQPKGPYQLGGWSLGGLVAFEMAQRLWARNEHVGLVALVDSYVSAAGEETESSDRRDLYAQFIQYLDLPLSGFFEVKEEFCRLTEDGQLTYVLEQIMAADERYMRLGLKRVRHLFRVFEIQTQAARRYAPKSYAGRVALFRAVDTATGHQKSSEIWTTVAAGGLDLHLVPGDHHTILQRPNVEVLADQLRAHLHHQS
jgi:thioesterase domain-containing protein